MSEPKQQDKPFQISTWVVWEASRRVKARGRHRSDHEVLRGPVRPRHHFGGLGQLPKHGAYYAHLLSAIGQREEAVLELDAMVPLMDNGDVDAAAMYVDLQMRQALTLARAGDESAWAR